MTSTSNMHHRSLSGRMTPWLVAIFVVLPLGCSKSPYDLASVRGKVTIDGQPLTKGRIVFTPAAAAGSLNAGKPAFGVVTADGSYSLATYDDDDGAVVGEHTITVFDTSDAPKFTRLVVPGRKSVASGTDNEINVELTSQDVLRLGRRE